MESDDPVVLEYCAKVMASCATERLEAAIQAAILREATAMLPMVPWTVSNVKDEEEE